jgi:hypothetical protein
MNYHFINRYCNVSVSPEAGVIIQLTGWITYANPCMLLLTDEEGDEIPISREDLTGSIVVVEEQREMKVKEGAIACLFSGYPY